MSRSEKIDYYHGLLAHNTLQALIARMQDAVLTNVNALLRTPPIIVREAMTLDVLDPPDLPVKPVKPNRYPIPLIGLVAGLMLAAVVEMLLKLRAVMPWLTGSE